MLQTVQLLLRNQFEASLCTLHHCVTWCPDNLWNAPIARYPFCQTAFHTLFFADYYLGPDESSQRRQPFHIENPALFGDYEQLQDREPVSLYQRGQIDQYLAFCRDKAQGVVASETQASLSGTANFSRRNISRAELHIYNIRHIQHHAAQMILRLRLETDLDVPWVGTGWREPAPRR